jgi:tetratricopeptide (TPR) repeat protein
VRLRVEERAAAELRNQVALYLWARANLEAARELLEVTRAAIEQRFGANDPELATALSTLGKVQHAQGDLIAARTSHERALAIRKRRRWRDPIALAWSLGNLGRALRKLGEPERASRLHAEALAILERRRGADDPDVAWSLGNLGRALQDLGDLEGAWVAHKRSLEIRKAKLPESHPDIAWSLRSLGSIHEARDQQDDARACYQHALDIFGAIFPVDHPEVVATRNYLDALRGPAPATEEGFESLFDGVDLRGWRMAGPGGFSVVGGGAIESWGGMGLLWYAERAFADFVLQLEWMATSGDDNSGVFIRFPDPDDDPWVAVDQGYEIQIDDRPSSAWKTGAIYDFSAPTTSAAKPIKTWNLYEVRAVGHHYTVILNGRTVNSYEGNRRLAGYLGLQNHHDGSRVRFRNMRIKTL